MSTWVLGLLIGGFFGWALLRALAKTTGTTVFSLPCRILAVVVVAGAIAGMVAAVLPGRRAAKLDVLSGRRAVEADDDPGLSA
jgi:putative ABC transport system permease protein